MKTIIWGGILLATVIVACVMIYEDLTLDPPGAYGGGASYSNTLVVGYSPGPQYGFQRESYWIDQAGEVVISYGDARRLPAGYRHHVAGYLLVGELRFPLPLRPWASATLAVLAVTAMSWFFAIHRARLGPQVYEAPIKS